MLKTVNNVKNRKGFTLIEVLFVIIVIAILAAIAIMRIRTTRANAEDSACASNQSVINTQLEQAMLDGFGATGYASGGDYPADQAEFDTFLTSTLYFPDGAPACQGAAPLPLPSGCAYNAATFRAACTTGNP